MKLKDFLIDLGVTDISSNQTTLFGKELLLIKEVIENSDEFKGVDIVEYFDELPKKEIFTSKIVGGMKPGKYHLYSVALSPDYYDVYSSIFGEQEALITPTLYNPKDFSPRKAIMLIINPECEADAPQDELMNNLRTKLHKLLDNVLDDLDGHKVIPSRFLMVRGYYSEQYEG